MKKWTKFILFAVLIFFLTACKSTSSLPEDVEKKNDVSPVSCKTGDIILADGSSVKTADFTGVDSANPPIAVIVEPREDGTALGMGVHRSEGPLPWTSGGDENYPASDFVNNYAETFHLEEAFASGWYIPDITELCTIYENRETINTALQKIYDFDNNAAMDGLGTNWYWSSSPSDTNEDYMWFVHFFNGYASDCPRDFDNLHTLAVRVF